MANEHVDAFRRETARALREHPESRAEVESMIDARVRQELARMRAESLAPPPPAAGAGMALDVPAEEPAIDAQAGRVYDLAYLEASLRGVPIKHTVMGRRHPRALEAGLAWMSEHRRTLDTETATAGAEYIPTSFSPIMLAAVDYQTRVASLFPRLPMTTKTLTVPVEDPVDQTAYLIGENVDPTAYHTLITESSPATSNVTLTARKLAIRTIASVEFEEDAAPICLARIQAKLSKSLARAVDSAIVSGDDSETHMDFDTTAAKDHRKLSKGLRKVAIANSVTQDLSTFTAENLLALVGKMGEYGQEVQDCVWLVQATSANKLRLLKDANNNLLMTRVSDLGPDATILKGVVGGLFGSPVVSCPKIRTNLAATGVNTEAGPNTYTVLHYVWRPAWAYGVRREPVIESFRWVGAQLVEFVINIRIDFEHGFGSEKTTGLGIKIS